MKMFFVNISVLISLSISAQTISIDLSKINDESVWKIHNREVASIIKEPGKVECIGLNAQQGDGLVAYQNLEFENGVIEFDVKGKDVLQQSFVGVAYHIQDEKTFNAIYFRPFNFKKSERASHSVQYICHPEYTWSKLRNDFPEQFEKRVNPVPDPNDWFHAKVEVNWPMVKVFVENSETPSLAIEMKSTFRKGKVGFWVGTGSDGWFKNLEITPEN